MIVQLKQPPAAQPARKASAPVARPAAAAAAAPVARPVGVPMGLVPSAAVMARLMAAPPLAVRAPGFATSIRSNPARRRTTFAQKVVFLAVWFTVFGLLGATVYVGSGYLPSGEEPQAVAINDLNPSNDGAKETATTPEPKKDPEPTKEPVKKEITPKKVETPAKKVDPPMKEDPPKKEMPPKKGKPIEKNPLVKPPPKRPIQPPPLRRPERPIETGGPTGVPVRPNTTPAVAGVFPRRLLAINVSNYLYYNPISYGPKLRDTHVLIGQLSRALQIPASQVFELSDGAPGALAKPPMKDVVTAAIKDFVATSRAQDRVILLFSGHALEIDGEAFLVPLEGEAGDKDSLIPLKQIYEQLDACKARQKVLILDVCRYDPARGSERPDSGKMSEKFEEILSKPPAGVQVWTACVNGQYSYEEGAILNGSIFLYTMTDALNNTNKDRRFELALQKPTESIPIVEMAEKINKWTTADVDFYLKQKQTPKVFGEENEGGAAYNAAEAPAQPVKMAWAEGQVFGAAPKDMIQGILRETSDIPPVKIAQEGVQPIRAETFPIFAKNVMVDYKEDKEETPFREAVKKATEVLKKHAQSFKEDFPSKNIDQLKQQVQPVQKGLAVTKLELEEALTALQDVSKDREKEKSKRWLATYDYVTARLLERISYVFEYQYMLSEVRTDALPELTENHIGWRLASREKMQCKGAEGKEAKERVKKAKEILESLTKDHKGTPYEILAKREILTSLGLEWQPLNGAGMGAKK